jgi:hypothetical protein
VIYQDKTAVAILPPKDGRGGELWRGGGDSEQVMLPYAEIRKTKRPPLGSSLFELSCDRRLEAREPFRKEGDENHKNLLCVV